MDDYDWGVPTDTGRNTRAGSSFMDRARAAPDDDDVPMGDARGEREQERESRGWGEIEEKTTLQQLLRHWTNERHAPDILPVQDMLLSGLLDHIRRQTETVHLLRSDPDTSEDEHFRIMLVQTEVERVKFVIRSYVRTRLTKIERFARWIVHNPDVQERLSQAELTHAQRFAEMVERHFFSTVTQSLPEEQRSLNDSIAFQPPMISEPDKTIAVFAHGRQNCPPVRLPDGMTLELERGQTTLTPYHVIEQFLLRDEVDLV